MTSSPGPAEQNLVGKENPTKLITFKNGPFPAFSIFFVFSTPFDIFCQSLYLNRGPLELEATARPTEPLPESKTFRFGILACTLA